MAKERQQNLGQHFLKDARALSRIADVLDITQNDVVMEIGPGHGELTRRILLAGPKRVIAIEKDEQLIKDYLIPLGDEFSNLETIAGDALIVVPKLLESRSFNRKTYKLAGNIPYYITGHLLKIIGGEEHKPERIVLTIQKEVAERICAKPPKMNLLAASVGFWGKPEIIRYISRKSFRPQPKVESAILRITPYTKAQWNIDKKRYYKFIRALFSHPRKMAINNITDGLSVSKTEAIRELERVGISATARPQNINIEDMINISNALEGKR